MQTLNYWKQFENTGRITDYLSYREQCDKAEGKYRTGDRGAVAADGSLREDGASGGLGASSGLGMTGRSDSITRIE